MGVSKRKPLPTAEELVALVEQHGSVVAVGLHLGVPEQTIHSHIRRPIREGDLTLRERVQAAKSKSERKPDRFSGTINWPSIDVL